MKIYKIQYLENGVKITETIGFGHAPYLFIDKNIPLDPTKIQTIKFLGFNNMDISIPLKNLYDSVYPRSEEFEKIGWE